MVNELDKAYVENESNVEKVLARGFTNNRLSYSVNDTEGID